jgi:hypothetical protein
MYASIDWRFTFAIPTLILAAWFATPYVVGIWGMDKPGEFGDRFGAINALFTGMAFYGVILTVVLQSRELQLQREELQATREELRGQKIQLETQSKILERQAADANFFRLLTIYRDFATRVQHPGQPERGVEYWRKIAKECAKHPELISARDSNSDFSDPWLSLYRRWEPTLGPYFAILGELLNLIADGSDDAQRRWSQILRAQIPPQEMIPLFYHAFSPIGKMYLKGYIEEFQLFKFFPTGDDYMENRFRNRFDVRAFT